MFDLNLGANNTLFYSRRIGLSDDGDHKRSRKSSAEFKADNSALLKEEIAHAADVLATECVQALSTSIKQ